MKAEGIFISTLLVIDTFLVSFCFGFNSRHIKVIDPSLPPLVPAHAEPSAKGPVAATRALSPAGEKAISKAGGAQSKSNPKSGETKRSTPKILPTNRTRTLKGNGAAGEKGGATKDSGSPGQKKNSTKKLAPQER